MSKTMLVDYFNRRLSQRILREHLGMGKSELYQILMKGLGFKPDLKVTYSEAQHMLKLTVENEQNPSFSAHMQVDLNGSQRAFLKNIQCFPSGGGEGTQFMANFIRTLNQTNVTELYIPETEKQGRLYWLRMGFYMDQGQWKDRYKNIVRNDLFDLKDQGIISVEQHHRFSKWIDEKSYYALNLMANCTDMIDEERQFNDYFFLYQKEGKGFPWKGGILKFNDRRQCGQVERYFKARGVDLNIKRSVLRFPTLSLPKI